MSTLVTGRYLGEKRLSVKHVDSGVEFLTDAPKDNNGLGSSFSPTDLVGTALGSCMITTMAIVAERDGIDLKSAGFQVEKTMSASAPRRIALLKVQITMPASLTEEQRTKLERVAQKCPVHHSLHPDTKVELEFVYSAS